MPRTKERGLNRCYLSAPPTNDRSTVDDLREAGLRAIADHIISQVAVVTEDRDWLHGLLVKAAREGADLERQHA